MNKKDPPLEILLVDDDKGDIDLSMEILNESKIYLNITALQSGEEALSYLNKKAGYENSSTPDLILLDLNMPKMSGIEVLQIIKKDNKLKKIPVVILTTSKDENDVARTYILGANCYITKPVGLEEFQKVVETIDSFWFTIVKFPPK